MIYLSIAFGILILVMLFELYIIKDLMDRLMAGGLNQYKAVKDGSKPSEPKSMSDRSEYEIWCKRNGITPEKEVKE